MEGLLYYTGIIHVNCSIKVGKCMFTGFIYINELEFARKQSEPHIFQVPSDQLLLIRQE